MNDGKTVFAQLFEHIPMNDFRKAVRRYRGEYNVQKFFCLDQFLCMAFAQLMFRESLRDIETCLRTVRHKLYHLGIRGGISRTTLAKANENRDWRIYADFAQVLTRTARGLERNVNAFRSEPEFARTEELQFAGRITPETQICQEKIRRIIDLGKKSFSPN